MPPGLTLEFPVADLGQRVDVKDMTEKLYEDIVSKVDESDVIGVQVVPQRWPKKVRIVCAHQAAKDCLMIQGLDLHGRHVELNEPGNGIIKVVIQDAPIEMPNYIIKAWVEQYGIVSEFRNEHATYKNKRLQWKTGVRYAYVSQLKESIPPWAKLPYDGGEVSITAWHYGQTHMKCRWCKEIVPKDDHNCDRAPSRKCFNCGSKEHFQAECDQGKRCYKCGSADHLARDCPGQDARQTPAPPVTTENAVSEPVTHSTPVQQASPEMSEMASYSLDDSVVLTESHENSVAEKSVANILLIGGSNCRDLQFKDDVQLDMRVTPLIQGGLLIEEASEKLDECTQTMRNDTDVVMVHVGSCNFPANDYADIDRHYTHYVELLNSISNSCPKAIVIISSILPRNGHKNVNINEQVNELNNKLSELAWREDKIYFSDNNVHFGLGEGDIDRDLFKTTDKSGLHLNADGQNRLAKVMANAIKELHFKRKLEIQLEETQD